MLSLLDVRSPWRRLLDYSMSLCNTPRFPHSPRGIVIQRIYVLERENPPSRGSTGNACARVILFLGLVSLMSSLGCTERIKAHLSTSTLCRPRRSWGKDILCPEFKTTKSFSLHKPYIVTWAWIVCMACFGCGRIHWIYARWLGKGLEAVGSFVYSSGT